MADAEVGASPGATINLKSVTKRYGDESVVNSISVNIAPGEFFSLLGPSGSGKTTTLMMVAGFTHPDAGQILVDGADIVQVPPQRRGFGMVFQNYAIFPHMSVYENVAFPLRARRLPSKTIDDRVKATLELVRLERFSKRFARQLSGGQQQRVAIARAIVFQPAVVLMDEPLGALDKNLRFEMQTEIKDIQKRLNMTVIYVTHDQEEAMNMSDRIAIMNGGNIEQVGTSRDVYESPASTFCAKFLGEANLIPVTVAGTKDNRAELHMQAGQPLYAKSTENLPANAPGQLFVRPERIRINEASMDGPAPLNRVAATIKKKSFLGNIIRYAASLKPDIDVTVDVQNCCDQSLTPGEEVSLSWHAHDCKVLLK